VRMRRVRTKMKDPTFVLTFVSALGCGLWPESSRIFELRHEGSGWRASHSRNCRPNCGTVIEAEEEVETLVEVFPLPEPSIFPAAHRQAI